MSLSKLSVYDQKEISGQKILLKTFPLLRKLINPHLGPFVVRHTFPPDRVPTSQPDMFHPSNRAPRVPARRGVGKWVRGLTQSYPHLYSCRLAADKQY